MLQAWRAETNQQFIQACEAAAHQRNFTFRMDFKKPDHLKERGLGYDFLKQQLQGILMELGFPDGTVTARCGLVGSHYVNDFRIEVKWSPEDASCTVSPPQTSRGTCTTCPICQEHRPAVALMPCGHVICRDCHRCQQLRQCPMCRGPITSATNGLFMD